MNRRKYFRFQWGTIFPVICILAVLIQSAYSDPLKDAPKGGYGRPAVSKEYSNLHPGIWQVLDDGFRMYVLSSSGERFIQVYDMEGNYEKTLFFQSLSANGKFFIATKENILYVMDEDGNVYIFQGGEFIRFLKDSDAEKELSHIDFRIRDSSGGYIVKNRSVWRISEPENICIIEGETEIGHLTNFSLAVFSALACICITMYLKRRGM